MMMEPPIEDLTRRIGAGRFELVTLASKRARQINAYYNQLGEGIGKYIPPQVISQGKPLSIAFQEIYEDKLVGVHPEHEEPEGSAAEESGDEPAS